MKRTQAITAAEVAIERLSDYWEGDVRSFAYGFLLGFGLSDEEACYALDDMNSYIDNWEATRG